MADKTGWAARRAAAELIYNCLEKRLILDEAMRICESFAALRGGDRAFAHAMSAMALRQLGRIDIILDQHLSKSLHATDPFARAYLRIGAAQIFGLKTPIHAAVSQTVEAAKRHNRRRPPYHGLVNAILRKLGESHGAFEAIDLRHIWPNWIYEKFCAIMDETECVELARYQLQEPPIDISTKGKPENVARNLLGQILPNGSIRLASKSILIDLPGFKQGEWWVQDMGARLAVDILSPKPGERVLDMCAAPGGKTLQLAANGAKVTALDRSEKRLKRLKENVQRTGLPAEIICADAVKYKPDLLFDKILLDAPCSAMGVLRRNPESAWIKTRKDIESFPDIQLRLVNAAYERLKPGGDLVYCVCSPFIEEGDGVIKAALKTNPWKLCSIGKADIPGFIFGNHSKYGVLCLPQSALDPLGCDIFYLVKLQKDS